MTETAQRTRRRAVMVAVLAVLLSVIAYVMRGRFSSVSNPSASSYALIIYRAPATVPDSEMVAVFATQARRRGATGSVVRFMPGVVIYPAETVGLPEAKAVVAEVVRLYPGLEAMVVVPRAGTSVVAWLDSAHGDMAAARRAMNEAGEDTWPVIYSSRRR